MSVAPVMPMGDFVLERSGQDWITGSRLINLSELNRSCTSPGFRMIDCNRECGEPNPGNLLVAMQTQQDISIIYIYIYILYIYIYICMYVYNMIVYV